MAPRAKMEVTTTGEALRASEAAMEPLPEADGPEKTGSVFYAKSGGLGPYVEGSSVLSTDGVVLWQAGVLRSAIEAARAEGYVVQMPFRIEDLDRISVSATAKTIPTT
ncbi:hypothetical protein AKG11_03600 [Shinella sp. SUS2]|uniref:hypothetical protein n=1 Tax=unclassified Shinella TaxID=2643062 RepID=UPI00067FF7CE|nr:MULTISPECIES: hypothetical protein [unclassified Shinella]KNY18229.1 hypothetical protein AKG11_03600 [Shinella sp. SUS2]KOC77424.1 hypothetical protein AKG10_01070 [Shinella sp. GWS1]